MSGWVFSDPNVWPDFFAESCSAMKKLTFPKCFKGYGRQKINVSDCFISWKYFISRPNFQ